MEIVLIILGCVLAAFLIVCGTFFGMGFIRELLCRWKALRRDAELWRCGQKPIGKLISVTEDGEGLKVEGMLFHGSIPGTTEISLGPFSMDPPAPTSYVKGERSEPTYDVLDMPDPNTKALSYKFKIDRDDIVNGEIEDLKAFVDKKVADFKTRVWNDGWVIVESEGLSTMESFDIDFNQHKICVEVVAVRREKT